MWRGPINSRAFRKIMGSFPGKGRGPSRSPFPVKKIYDFPEGNKRCDRTVTNPRIQNDKNFRLLKEGLSNNTLLTCGLDGTMIGEL